MYGKETFPGLSGVLELLMFHEGCDFSYGMMAPELLGISYQQHPQMSQASELCYDFSK